jgi:hypothetical protein
MMSRCQFARCWLIAHTAKCSAIFLPASLTDGPGDWFVFFRKVIEKRTKTAWLPSKLKKPVRFLRFLKTIG